jgi:hypothetical protein
MTFQTVSNVGIRRGRALCRPAPQGVPRANCRYHPCAVVRVVDASLQNRGMIVFLQQKGC